MSSPGATAWRDIHILHTTAEYREVTTANLVSEAVRYHALAEELVASHQPTEGENGWDLLVQAIDRMQAFAEQNEGPDYYANGYLHLVSPADWNEEEYEVGREQLTAAGMEGLAGLREAGVWDSLDQLARSPRVVRPLLNDGILLDVLLPELGRARSLAQVLGAFSACGIGLAELLTIAGGVEFGSDADADVPPPIQPTPAR